MAFNSLSNEAGLSKEWIEGTDIPKLSPEEMDAVREIIDNVPFYLCIDEINRGDISRIFGELITLLESDKRYNGKDSYFVTLPYSKTQFAVPPNLYIIGTMNTADKSIALVDVALRRRFGFIELMPEYKILEANLVSEDSSIQDIFSLAISTLQILNERILLYYDRDHQIGHSFFLKLKDCASSEECIEKFQFLWYYEVLPLLQEYFYDSPKKFQEVIGDKFIKTTPNKKAFIFTDMLYEDDFIEAIRGLSTIQTDDNSSEEESE
jgi:5-methylcytosine-specific restriction protein B